MKNENQQLSCILHDEAFMWYVIHRCRLGVLDLGPSKYILVLTWSWSSISTDRPFLGIWVDSENSNGLAVVRRSMDKFHVEGCARSVFFVRDACAIFIIRARYLVFVHNIYYSCAICARFMYYSCTICARFMYYSCVICARSVYLYAHLARTMFL